VLVLHVPLNRIVIHALEDRRIVSWLGTRLGAPEDDGVVLLQEDQFARIDLPLLRSIKAIENLVESRLPPGDQIVIPQCLGKTDTQSFLGSPNPGLGSSLPVREGMPQRFVGLPILVLKVAHAC
jgi:hypothetical protein